MIDLLFSLSGLEERDVQRLRLYKFDKVCEFEVSVGLVFAIPLFYLSFTFSRPSVQARWESSSNDSVNSIDRVDVLSTPSLRGV